MRYFLLAIGAVCVALFIYFNAPANDATNNAATPDATTTTTPFVSTKEAHRRDSARRAALRGAIAKHLDFVRIKDTIYVLGNRYITVSLQEQRAVLHWRNGDTLSIPISSGNPKTKDGKGIATKTGIFSIQNKSPEAISRQFDNTKMLWWIGFNYNIGFHGLEQNFYYRYLGKKVSSHGCVRTGREDVEKLYKLVDMGVPVMVYETEPARVFAFADSATFDTTRALKIGSRSKFLNKTLAQRLDFLYSGLLYERQPFQIYMDGTTQLRPGGYEPGDATMRERPQQRPVQLAANAERASTMHRDYFQQPLFTVPLNPRIDSSLSLPDSLAATEPVLAKTKPRKKRFSRATPEKKRAEQDEQKKQKTSSQQQQPKDVPVTQQW